MDTVPEQGVVEHLQFFRPSSLPGVEMMHVTGCTRLWRVYHERFTLATLIVAEGEWIYRGRTLPQRTGDTCMMEPGETHVSTRLAGPGDFRTLHLEPAVLHQAAVELGLRLPDIRLRKARVVDEDLRNALLHLHEAAARMAGPLELQSKFAAALRLYLERCFEGHPRSAMPDTASTDGLKNAHDYILDNLGGPVALDDLARESGHSRFHLAHAFTRRYGLPPHRFQLLARVERSRRLLLGGATIAQTAADLGFTDQSHFTACFRKVLGVTPGAYLGRKKKA